MTKERLTSYVCLTTGAAKRLFAKFEELELESLDKAYFFKLYNKGRESIDFSIRFGTWCVGNPNDTSFDKTVVELNNKIARIKISDNKYKEIPIEEYFSRDWRSEYKPARCLKEDSVLDKNETYLLDMNSIYEDIDGVKCVQVYQEKVFAGVYNINDFILL